MEIKHGRAAMLAFLHVIHVEAGVRFPGYLSGSAELKFSDVHELEKMTGGVGGGTAA